MDDLLAAPVPRRLERDAAQRADDLAAAEEWGAAAAAWGAARPRADPHAAGWAAPGQVAWGAAHPALPEDMAMPARIPWEEMGAGGWAEPTAEEMEERAALMRPLELNNGYSYKSNWLYFDERDPERNRLVRANFGSRVLPRNFKDYPIDIIRYDLATNHAIPSIHNREIFNMDRQIFKYTMENNLLSVRTFIHQMDFRNQPVQRLAMFNLVENDDMKDYWQDYVGYPDILQFIERQAESMRTGGQKKQKIRSRHSKRKRMTKRK